MILCALLLVGYTTWVLVVTRGSSSSLSSSARVQIWITLLLVGLAGIYTLGIGSVVRIRLSETELEIRNLRTHRIPLADIAAVEPGFLGLVIVRRDLHAKSVTALGFGKSAAAKKLGIQVRADRIGQAISNAAEVG